MKNLSNRQWVVWMLAAVIAGMTSASATDDGLEKARRAVKAYMQANPSPQVVGQTAPASDETGAVIPGENRATHRRRRTGSRSS